MNIFIYSPNWIGDAVMAIPFIEELKNIHPNSKIHVFCRKWVAGIYENNPCVDEIIPFSDEEVKGLKNMLNIGSFLRKRKFALAYTLTESLRSAFVLWLSRSPVRYGYRAQMRSMFLTEVVSNPVSNIHRSLKYVNLIKQEADKCLPPRLYLTKTEKDWAEEELETIGYTDPIAIFPFSVAESRTFPHKTLRKWLRSEKENYLIFGSKNDAFDAQKLVPSFLKISIKSLCGKYSFRQSIALISKCKYALAADSGLGHVSSALSVPTISIFGAGLSSVTAPIGKKTNIINKNVLCSPCRKNTCHNYDNPLICIREISNKDIEIAINNIINP
tara:strand:- start:8014 stop:9003 length:990 start_codon:yes stop_codon:yes gene_type:complete